MSDKDEGEGTRIEVSVAPLQFLPWMMLLLLLDLALDGDRRTWVAAA